MNALILLLTAVLPLVALCLRLGQHDGSWTGQTPNLTNSWGDKVQSSDSGAIEPLVAPHYDDSLVARVPDIDTFKTLWTARYASERRLNEPLPSSIKLILGLFTVPQDAAYRQVVRETWLQQTGVCYWTKGPRDDCSVYTAFVLGKSGLGERAEGVPELSAEELAKVHKEEGILTLDITENMNSGKTFVWLSTALRMFPWATHIGKMDMDTYPLLHKLVNRMDANRSCVHAASPYEFIGRPHWSNDMETFKASCPYRPCLGHFLPRADVKTLSKSGEWCFLEGGLYILSVPLVGKLLAPILGDHEDHTVTENVHRSAREQDFCVATRFLDSWFHRTNSVDKEYINDF